jgi:hypothetical protein
MPSEKTWESLREKNAFKERAVQLFYELQGPKWSQMARMLEEEGFVEDGKPLTANALRKRFDKDSVLRGVLDDYRQEKPQREETARSPIQRPGLPVTRVKRNKIADRTTDTAVTAKEMLALLQGSMQRRDEMLLEQIRQSHTISDTTIIRQIEEEVKLMEVRLNAIEERLEILVEDKVEENLKSMVTPGGSFERDLESLVTRVIEKKLSGESGSILSAIPLSPGQGGARWEGEGKMARFSATMPQHLFDALKAINTESSFSARIAAAVDLYLRAMAAQR